jgi:hypothetical protein
VGIPFRRNLGTVSTAGFVEVVDILLYSQISLPVRNTILERFHPALDNWVAEEAKSNSKGTAFYDPVIRYE